MTDGTPLDRAHAHMIAHEEDNAARLQFYRVLAGCELFLMLTEEPDGISDAVSPEVFEVQDASFVLVFDLEERLVAFSERQTPYVSVSGRTIAGMVAGNGLGLGLNLDVAPSSMLLPPDAVLWLHETLGNTPVTTLARIAALHPPAGLPELLMTSLDDRLASAVGLASAAYLAGATFEDGTGGHLLAFLDAIPEAQSALAQIASEALTFSGIDAGTMDVAFFRAGDAIVARLERTGIRFDLPQVEDLVTAGPKAPGMDPAKPPRLK